MIDDRNTAQERADEIKTRRLAHRQARDAERTDRERFATSLVRVHATARRFDLVAEDLLWLGQRLDRANPVEAHASGMGVSS